MQRTVTSAPKLVNHLKEKLASGQIVSSMAVRLCRSIEIAGIAAAAGFDSLYVDLEHNTLSIDAAGQICIAAQQLGVTPLVRVPANSADYIGRVLDGGAMGVIVPHVRSAADAATAVRFATYPPSGKRSLGGALSHLGYRGGSATEMMAAVNAATFVAVMLETPDSIANAKEIAAVPGVDLLLVGASDLSAELAIAGEFDHPQIEQAFQTAIAAARQHGKHVGVGGIASRDDLMAKFARMGAHYVSTGTDLAFLLQASTQRAAFVAKIGA